VDLFTSLDRLVWHQDEPFATTSIFAQWQVFQLASTADIKVMLDGQGADELLCGYPSFFRACFCGWLRSGHWSRAWREALARRGSYRGALSSWLRAFTDAAVPVSWQKVFRRSSAQRRNPDWLALDRLQADFPGPWAARFRDPRSASDLSVKMLTGGHLQMLLHWEDRNSMAHSLEARVPFLDYRLVEFLLGLPDHYKISDGATKAVLRQGLRKIVPDRILQRRDKMGFVTPEELWVKQLGTDRFRRALMEAIENCQGILRPQALQYLEDVLAGRRSYDSILWRMIVLGVWMKQFKATL
jgi:asparagine synthase (glutamine-hydrolysing)